MNRLQLAIVLSLVCICCVGCGGGGDGDRPSRVPVSGVITISGQPLAGATVVFIPVAHNYGATAMTDSDGAYELQTFDPKDGAVPGRYQVTVRKVESPVGVPATEEPPDDDDAGPLFVEKSLIPAKYGQPNTSGLEAQVAESGENKLSFDL